MSNLRQNATFLAWRKLYLERVIPVLATQCGVSEREVRDLIAESDRAESMPDAEVTPTIVHFRNIARAGEREGWQAFIACGAELRSIRELYDDAEFAGVLDRAGFTKEEAALAMKAAEEFAL